MKCPECGSPAKETTHLDLSPGCVYDRPMTDLRARELLEDVLILLDDTRVLHGKKEEVAALHAQIRTYLSTPLEGYDPQE